MEALTTRRFDLLVVGGGITGAGIALDAATRGLRVALVEKGDFASGTSSKSSKLIHGGLRYLEQRDFKLMREAATERDRLRRIAPTLVTPVPFLLPRWSGGKRKAGVGLWLYDVLATFGNHQRHRRIDTDAAVRLVPGTRKKAGGYLYYDSQTDDVRLTLAVLKAARLAGAVIANYVRVDGLFDVGGRVAGCEATDAVGGGSLRIKAADTVNATGVWADDLCLAESSTEEPRLRPSKGVHLLVRRSALPLRAACLIPTSERRLIFTVPWRSSVLVGTTDTEYDGPLDAPRVLAEELTLLLESLSTNFERDFSPNDVVGAFAGLRPLLRDDGAPSATTRDLSRKHAVFRGPKGLLTVTGGKLTTYRVMAEEAVDIITRRAGYRTRSITASVPLASRDPAHLAAEATLLSRELGLPPSVVSSLIFSYGDDAPRILALAREEELAVLVSQDLPYIEAELIWAARHEMAVRLEDFFSRRTRIALEDPSGGLGASGALEKVASSMAWSPEKLSREAAAYRKSLENERGPLAPAITLRS